LGNRIETFNPDMLVSLAAPKICAVFHDGPHYLGGRYLPECI
jgi:hypothetical protein